jgi:hypothetical protein
VGHGGRADGRCVSERNTRERASDPDLTRITLGGGVTVGSRRRGVTSVHPKQAAIRAAIRVGPSESGHSSRGLSGHPSRASPNFSLTADSDGGLGRRTRTADSDGGLRQRTQMARRNRIADYSGTMTGPRPGPGPIARWSDQATQTLLWCHGDPDARSVDSDVRPGDSDPAGLFPAAVPRGRRLPAIFPRWHTRQGETEE